MKHILVIDDNVTNLKLAKAALGNDYKVTMLTSGVQALKFLEKNVADLILLDIEMPDMDGFSVLESLKQYTYRSLAPVIFLTALTSDDIEARALSLGVVDFISKPFVKETLCSRVRLHLEISDYRKGLEYIVAEKTKMVEDLQNALSISIAGLVGCRDGYTGEHVKRTCAYIKILSEQMYHDGLYPDELDRKFIDDIHRAAPLHDIGKVGISDAILCKPGLFTPDEFELMKLHTRLGGATLQNAIEQTGVESFLYMARDMALYHHEKWNGQGYLECLSGTDIPLCARIMTVVDIYDALTSKRPYKEPLSHGKAAEIILSGRGTSFEPRIVDSFEACSDEFEMMLDSFSQTVM